MLKDRETLRLLYRAKKFYAMLSSIIYLIAFVIACYFEMKMVFLIVFLLQWAHQLHSHTFREFKKILSDDQKKDAIRNLLRESFSQK